eukprot:CAMPEP_0203883030 /NCGR_PEP_ID=MMETSP0359-20131031/27166_1 /ASSEMBLY_ACC=CAM_ASM_000338 /TAXON_ID=268821 /ORGANISM="Scrippsiella Hangoei, Strain SHTV-5" /LENGTH=557 /DNA_ID=CAMNT_0050803155 /DNA_START=21 /DNA_END=1690 /DNA_ORIENTATION=-
MVLNPDWHHARHLPGSLCSEVNCVGRAWTDVHGTRMGEELFAVRRCFAGNYIPELCPPDIPAKGCWWGRGFYTEDVCCDLSQGRRGLEECWDKDFTFLQCCLRGSPCRRELWHQMHRLRHASSRVYESDDGTLQARPPAGDASVCERAGGQVRSGEFALDASGPPLVLHLCMPRTCLDHQSASWAVYEMLRNISDGLVKEGGVQLWRRSQPDEIQDTSKLPSNSAATRFVEACRQSKTKAGAATLKIERWMGRGANNVFQILNALVLGYCSGIDLVRVFSLGGDLRKLFPNLPSVLEARREDWPRSCFCRQCSGYKPDCGRVWGTYCVTTFAERRKLVRQVLEPYLETRAPPQMPDLGIRERREHLTIHLRSGDVKDVTPRIVANGDHRSDHLQPPCAYYHDIIARQRGGRSFREVLVVSADDRHPCIADITARWQDRVRLLVLQSGSASEDFRTLMNAENLAMSRSSFAGLALLFHRRLKRLFHVLGREHLTAWMHCGDGFEAELYESWSQTNAAELCEALRPEAALTFYRIPIADYMQAADSDYFLGYNASKMEG